MQLIINIIFFNTKLNHCLNYEFSTKYLQGIIKYIIIFIFFLIDLKLGN